MISTNQPKMKKELTYEQALFKAVDMCSRVERCEADARARLTEWVFEESDIDKIIAWLKKEKYLDEARFCSMSVRRAMGINKWGRVKIAYNLRVKKAEESFIQKALLEINEKEYLETLDNLIKGKDNGLKFKNKYEHRSKLYSFALSRGYEPELINAAIKKNVEL